MRVTLDFETASTVDLKVCGAARYFEDPTTEILCLRWKASNGHRGGWRPGQPVAGNPLLAYVLDPTCEFEAHNTWFELNGWRRQMVADYGWPDISNVRWFDTMAVCAYKSMPLKLEHAVKALGLPIEKDMVGSKLTRKLSKPHGRGKLKGTYDRSEATLERVEQYCDTDVDAEFDLGHRVGELSRAERGVWLLDLEINQRGVAIDHEYVRKSQQIVDMASAPLIEEFSKITGGLEPTQVKAILPWVHAQGVKLPNLQKATIAAALGLELDEEEDDDDDEDYRMVEDVVASLPGLCGDDTGLHTGDTDLQLGASLLPTCVRRALEIRAVVGSASVKKLRRMLKCVNSDGRIRGLLQYHAAHPGRWGGRLIQPQNFPRGVITIDKGTPNERAPSVEAMVSAIMTGDPDYVQAVLGDPIEVVLSGLRHALVARPDYLFVVGDFAGVEARLVLALAGQYDKTAIMAAGGDPYIDVANLIFGRAITKAMTFERTIGKSTVLGCGFQMGWDTFRKRYAKTHGEAFCREVIRVYREEWAPRVPQLWYGLEEAAVRCVWDNQVTEYAGIEFRKEDGWLTMRLPSGRKIWYWHPEPCEGRFGNRAWSYYARKNGRWLRIQAYGGLITENVIQGLARDLLVRAMFRCRLEGIPVVLTVHDEIVAEQEIALANKDVLDQIMCDRPQWAINIQAPIKADCWVGPRYKK